MTPSPSERFAPIRRTAAVLIALLSGIGASVLDTLERTGFALYLLGQTIRWIVIGIVNPRVRLGRPAIITQLCRVGVSSIYIVMLVSGSIGLILAVQLAPPLDEFGQRSLVANIVGVAILRELGPLIAAIVMTGFAGASITAELGTMVVGEEIEALRAMGLNPNRFLVLPRVIAAVVSMTALAVLSDIVAIGASLMISVTMLDIPYATYVQNTLDQIELVDFLTGIFKATIFGTIIGLIACANGLRVSGGAAGVGRATTMTVVQSIVAIIVADLVFTAIFFAVGLV